MQNIENRLTKLETVLVSNHDTLIVFSKCGETKDIAVARVIEERKLLHKNQNDFYVMYFDVHKSSKLKCLCSNKYIDASFN